MKIAVLDLETSKKPVMHPWMKGAYLSTVGMFVAKQGQEPYYKDWVFTHQEWEGSHGHEIHNLYAIQAELDDVDTLVAHNLKFDANWLKSKNISIDHLDLWDTAIADYMINGQEKIGYTLGGCCYRWGLPVKTDMVKTYWDAGKDTHEVPLRILLPYQKNDVMITAELFKKQYAEIKKSPALSTLLGVRNEALHIMTDLEMNGMPFDKTAAEKHVEHFQQEMLSTDRQLKSYFGQDDINLDSGNELSACLFGGKLKRVAERPQVYTKYVTYKEAYQFTYKSGKHKGKTITKYKNRKLQGLFCKKVKVPYEIDLEGVGFEPADNSECKRNNEPTGYYQTNKDVLKNLKCTAAGSTTAKHKREILRSLLHRSKIVKFVSTFVGAKKGTGLFHVVDGNLDGYCHPSYNQTIAATGRLTSSNPNGQNFPRSKADADGFTNPLKSVFIPSRPGGLILTIDLSQLEWRIGAWLSQDPVAMSEILNDIDCHADNAVNFFGDIKYRQDAKIMTFRLLYGGSAFAFWIDPLMPNFSKGKWNEIVDSYKMKYRVLTKWQEDNIISVPKTGGILTSPLGRLYKIPMIPHKKYGNLIHSETCIKNYPVQGTATGDVVPLAMNMMRRRMMKDPMAYMSTNWMGQVHDSMIFDTMPHEVKRVAHAGITVFEELPATINKMWGVDFNLPLTGEAEWGPNYGTITHTVKHEGGQWIFKQK
jgi:DNA polymerase I-like protein with 3'-5' exonuclease and polymerase domains